MFLRAGNKYIPERKAQGLTVHFEEKKSLQEEKEEAWSFSIEVIIVSCPTDTFFLPLKRHDPNQKSMK